MERHNYKYVRHDTGRNPGYPGKYSVSGDCEWKINKLSDDICQIRLDFETMEIADPNGNNINSTSLFLSFPAPPLPPPSPLPPDSQLDLVINVTSTGFIFIVVDDPTTGKCETEFFQVRVLHKLFYLGDTLNVFGLHHPCL